MAITRQAPALARLWGRLRLLPQLSLIRVQQLARQRALVAPLLVHQLLLMSPLRCLVKCQHKVLAMEQMLQHLTTVLDIKLEF